MIMTYFLPLPLVCSKPAEADEEADLEADPELLDPGCSSAATTGLAMIELEDLMSSFSSFRFFKEPDLVRAEVVDAEPEDDEDEEDVVWGTAPPTSTILGAPWAAALK